MTKRNVIGGEGSRTSEPRTMGKKKREGWAGYMGRNLDKGPSQHTSARHVEKDMPPLSD